MKGRIMLQGTMSNVGKSFLTAALCRILHVDGIPCAPFKAQNMALNSYITPDGLELGRAQAMQAQAAGLEPDVRMNPVLLKPTTDTGSQVIVRGRVHSDMGAVPYFRYRHRLMPVILECYRSLQAQYDVLVIEGAGSPCELNLRRDDIVNMGLARAVGAPVLLIGDIDRGGIFAQLLGTLSLLEPEERSLVRGLIVNNFRGDASLFDEGVRILEERSGLPVLGVIPHLTCELEDEDSLSAKLHAATGEGVDIAVIRLPRLSNFTDLDPLTQYDGVRVRYVDAPSRLGIPDLIVLPGTKSTIADGRFLQESGLGAAIVRLHALGVPVFGICGGYQLMGCTVSDPEGVEGGGSIRGLGLLAGETVLAGEKHRSRTQGTCLVQEGFFSCLHGAHFSGYEIHHGVTDDPGPPLTTAGGSVCGHAAGCYIHGFFDRAQVSGALIRALCERRGLPFAGGGLDRDAFRETQFAALAEGVRAHLDMARVRRIMEEDVHGA
ncbi:MAG: cobyric acid synthase [Oscillospiraceae bacterium]|nr:cobyric acid synthase [Oscillospiraceae bacterium]